MSDTEYQKSDPFVTLKTILEEISVLQNETKQTKTQLANDMDFLIKEFERFNLELKNYQEQFLKSLAEISQKQIESTLQEFKKELELLEPEPKKSSLFGKILKKK